jgi:hypothetical protein
MYQADSDDTYSRNSSETDSQETESTMNTQEESKYGDEDDDEEDEEEDSVYSDEDDEIINHIEWMDILDPIQITNKKYYIGCYEYMPYDNSTLLLVNKIHRNTFMKFNNLSLSKYFFWYSGVSLPKRPSIDILQLHITEDDIYTVVVKTFWIRIIQIIWKKIYIKRQEYKNWRKKLETINLYALGKITPPQNIYYPSINGMLSFLLPLSSTK